ncbi:MAG TPA: TlpA disulfide reductase family protein [bacterium]|nr:TlpA disulfide reductase family protein [bacterium]
MMLLIAAFCASLAGCATAPQTSADAGAPVPVAATTAAGNGSFTLDLATYDGGRFSFEEVRGKKHLLVAFWATWCDPCKVELKELAALYDRYRDKIEFVAVSTDAEESMDRVRSFVIENSIPFPVLVDPSKKQVGALLPGGDTVPYSLLVLRDGAVFSSHTGYEPGDEERIARELDELSVK